MGSRRLILPLCVAVLCSYGIAAVASQNGSTAPVASERHIPFKSGDETSTGATVLRVVAGLGVVLVIGVVALVALRKFVPMVSSVTPPGRTREIELIELRRLTPRLTLFLVEVHGTRYLFAQSGDRLVPLTPSPPKTQEA